MPAVNTPSNNGSPRSEPLRADSARARARMLAAARERLAAGDRELPLNAVAKAAGVGVGTVYRHFPSRRALIESLAAPGFAALVADARAGAADPDSGAGLARLLAAGLRAMRHDPTLAEVLSDPDLGDPDLGGAETAELSRELAAVLVDLLGRAKADGAVRPDLTPDDLRRLMCGIQHAIDAGGGDGAADRYLEILLSGLRDQKRAGSR